MKKKLRINKVTKITQIKAIFSLLILLLVSSITCSVFAQQIPRASEQAKTELQQRLNKITQLHAVFTQKVFQDDFLIQEGKGEFWIKRPNLFRWQMSEPDSLSLISNGKTIWYYTPAIHQVSLMSFENSENTQLWQLLTNNKQNEAFWQNYTVTQKADHFYINPKDQTESRFELTLSKTGQLMQMVMIEADDQRTTYQLSAQSVQPIPLSYFEFKIPKGTTIDDHR